MDFPSAQAIATVTATTAGTSIIVPSSATSAIYVTGLLISNGATAGWEYFGYGTSATAPTGSAILIQNTYLAINGFVPVLPLAPYIFKVPSGQNFLATTVTCTTNSITALYYLAA